jgi:hypothetical protein
MVVALMHNNVGYEFEFGTLKENFDKDFDTKIMLEPLESRMLKILRSLEDSSRIFRQIMLDEKAKPMDRIKASKKMVNDQYNILRLLRMGPNNFEYCGII